ncbi:RNA polymerase sigma factor [Cohnella herbarum]|uniref:RNA polymerase sigma factor n=1 Tax=Cohnella herbarum TaxID=2728023 RepID=A0A7Z2ZJX0_9BACL|nr:RNA polymerase sigma factor [Cohnella herbarum]QJD82611.1 RNA polymerase sigma factor [Cohnella herbarum]
MDVNTIFDTWVSPHLVDLKKYCHYLTKSKWDAEDLFQETQLKAMVFFVHSAPYLDVKLFLVRVARNLWIDDCRKRQRRRGLAVAVVDSSKAYYTDNDYVEIRSTIEWLSERFPRRNIEMWLLFTYFRYSMQEIATDMASTIPTVKSVLFRTRDLLRQRHELKISRPIIHYDVERWSRAIMQDRPQGILSQG